jgi:hypothetical protein
MQKLLLIIKLVFYYYPTGKRWREERKVARDNFHFYAFEMKQKIFCFFNNIRGRIHNALFSS